MQGTARQSSGQDERPALPGGWCARRTELVLEAPVEVAAYILMRTELQAAAGARLAARVEFVVVHVGVTVSELVLGLEDARRHLLAWERGRVVVRSVAGHGAPPDQKVVLRRRPWLPG